MRPTKAYLAMAFGVMFNVAVAVTPVPMEVRWLAWGLTLLVGLLCGSYHYFGEVEVPPVTVTPPRFQLHSGTWSNTTTVTVRNTSGRHLYGVF